MTELTATQIEEKLNQEFKGNGRKLIFWYDDDGDFADEVQEMRLENAAVYYLQRDNQLRTKVFLERQEKEKNYLLYAPFSRPPAEENHLEDMLLYSVQFHADKASILLADLGIDDRYKAVIQTYMKFFQNKERLRKFRELEIERFTKQTIETGLMSILCQAKTVSFEDVVKTVVLEGGLEDNSYLDQFKKYGLFTPFWSFCEDFFGYSDTEPTIEKLMITCLVTHMQRSLSKTVPKKLRDFLSYKPGNVIAFVESLKGSILYHDQYNKLSETIAEAIDLQSVLKDYSAEEVLECDTFAWFDEKVILWIVERLLAEDKAAVLQGATIDRICDTRRKKHFGRAFRAEYYLLEHALSLVSTTNYGCPSNLKQLSEQYATVDYKIDTAYRKFYYWYDQLEDTSAFEGLRDLMENIYTGEYLDTLLPKWSKALEEELEGCPIPLQRRFYHDNLEMEKERTAVIISDAFRYEVAAELADKLQEDSNCSNARITGVMGVLPSFTPMGMAALLPHEQLTLSDNMEVLVDGSPCASTQQRQSKLQRERQAGKCTTSRDLKMMKSKELRDFFAGTEIVYIYHNQIDARGEEYKTENEVFSACQDAIEELFDLIKKISKNGNTYRFIVTADHGFLYKRDRLKESSKISLAQGAALYENRRFVLADDGIAGSGILSLSMGLVLGTDDQRVLSMPTGSSIFKMSGAGQNYVHGGPSPQEILLPLLTLKTKRGAVQTVAARIALVSTVRKLTGLVTSLEFIQKEPVSDTVSETSYRISLINERGQSISNEQEYIADSRADDAKERIFRLRFMLKNQRYSAGQPYYLMAYDVENDMEAWRHELQVDLAFTDDYELE